MVKAVHPLLAGENMERTIPRAIISTVGVRGRNLPKTHDHGVEF